MALSVPNTVNDIMSAIDALPPTATENQRWTAAITALYTRIKADLSVQSSTTDVGADPQGGVVNSTGTATSTTVL